MEHLKYCQVVFEGVNRAGKTTTKEAFEKLTNYKYITIDRSLITGMVMTKLFNRTETTYDLEQFKNVVFVYLYASDETIQKRYVETGHEEFPWRQEKSLFDSYVEQLRDDHNLKILQFNTDMWTPQQIAETIQAYMKGLNS